MALTHARLREIKLRMSGSDIKELVAFAEETLGPPPPPTVYERRDNGELVELTPRDLNRRARRK